MKLTADKIGKLSLSLSSMNENHFKLFGDSKYQYSFRTL